MFDYEKSPEVSRKVSVAALAASLLCVALLILGRLINATSSAPAYSPEAETVQHISTGIIVAFALVAPVGLLLSVVALVKATRKPAVYGGKGIAVAALVLNGIFSLVSIGVVLMLLSYAGRYHS